MYVMPAPGIPLRIPAALELVLLWQTIPKTHDRIPWIHASLFLRKTLWTLSKKRPWSLSLRVTRLLGMQVA